MSDISNSPQANPQAAPEGPAGIGGWLILPIVHLVLNAGYIFYTFGAGVLAGAHAAEPGEPAAASSNTFLIYVGFFELAVAIYAIYCLVRFFQKKREVPKLMITFYVFLLLSAIGEFSALPSPTAATPDGLQGLSGLVRTVIFCGVWIPYFAVSKRVKNTFIR